MREDSEDGVGASDFPGVVWRKSRYSNPSGNCVELAELADGGIAVRNSRYPHGAALVYTRAEIAAFIRGAKSGEFDEFAQAKTESVVAAGEQKDPG